MMKYENTMRPLDLTRRDTEYADEYRASAALTGGVMRGGIIDIVVTISDGQGGEWPYGIRLPDLLNAWLRDELPGGDPYAANGAQLGEMIHEAEAIAISLEAEAKRIRIFAHKLLTDVRGEAA